MIQRIQTLYLLVVSCLMLLMLLFPLGSFLMDNHELALNAFGFDEVRDGETIRINGTTSMGVLMVLAAVVPFLTIFMFKNRILQIRMCFVEMVLLLGVLIFEIYYLYHATATVNSMETANVVSSYSLVNTIPVICLILTWLANRGIMKDEALIKSMNRIR